MSDLKTIRRNAIIKVWQDTDAGKVDLDKFIERVKVEISGDPSARIRRNPNYVYVTMQHVFMTLEEIRSSYNNVIIKKRK